METTSAAPALYWFEISASSWDKLTIALNPLGNGMVRPDEPHVLVADEQVSVTNPARPGIDQHVRVVNQHISVDHRHVQVDDRNVRVVNRSVRLMTGMFWLTTEMMGLMTGMSGLSIEASG